jgi:hypothetical protein
VNFKVELFVVAVFLWFSRVIIEIHMPQEATRSPNMVSWGRDLSRKNIFLFPNILWGKYYSTST